MTAGQLDLLLTRIAKRETYTIGRLYANGIYICDTIEDRDRGLTDNMPEAEIIRRKVYGHTAIPTGTYPVDMDTVSPKFKSRIWAKPYDGKLPRIQNVKGFSGVLIHVGNTEADTLGCILVGRNKVVGKVVDSTVEFSRLMNDWLIPAHAGGKKITITVK